MMFAIYLDVPEKDAQCGYCDFGGYGQIVSLTKWDDILVKIGQYDEDSGAHERYRNYGFSHLYCLLRHTSGGSAIRNGRVGGKLAIIEGENVIISTMEENDLRPVDGWTERVIPADTEFVIIEGHGENDFRYVRKDKTFTCAMCEKVKPERQLHQIAVLDESGDELHVEGSCMECVIEKFLRDYFACQQCRITKHRTWLSEIDQLRDWDICSMCDEVFFECEDCGQWTCPSWSHHHEVIRDASFTPALKFFPDDNQDYYFGFELEVETPDEDDANWWAERVVQKLNFPFCNTKRVTRALRPFYLKHDGSLDCGFEIVSHPATIEWFRDSGVLDVINTFPRELDLRSWDTDTCGFHVHVSRTAFHRVNANRVIYSKAHELRFIALFYRNEHFIEALAGRSSNNYATFGTDEFRSRAQHYRGKVSRKEMDKYQVINTRHDNTLEIRIFRGTLRKERILSNLQLVKAGIEYTRNLETAGLENIKNLTSNKFIEFITSNKETYPELVSAIEALPTDYHVSEQE